MTSQDDPNSLKARLDAALDTRFASAQVASELFKRTHRLGDLAPVLSYAEELQVSSARGLHVDLSDSTQRVRFTLGASEPLSVRVELTNGRFESIGPSLVWEEDDDPLIVAQFLAEQLQRQGALRPTFPPEELFTNWAELLFLLVRHRLGRGGISDLAPAIYAPNETWVVTDYGLECTTDRYAIQASRLTKLDWVEQLRWKVWTNYDEVYDAVTAATAIHRKRRSRGGTAATTTPAQVPVAAPLQEATVGATARPRVFIASSSEALSVAEALQANLERDADVTLWTNDVFGPTEAILESLQRIACESDYGIFVLYPEDILQIRGTPTSAARDNVVFELGLFVGRLGARSCFLIKPRSLPLKLPSDILSMVPLEYDDTRADGNLAAALGPASRQVRLALSKRKSDA